MDTVLTQQRANGAGCSEPDAGEPRNAPEIAPIAGTRRVPGFWSTGSDDEVTDRRFTPLAACSRQSGQ